MLVDSESFARPARRESRGPGRRRAVTIAALLLALGAPASRTLGNDRSHSGPVGDQPDVAAPQSPGQSSLDVTLAMTVAVSQITGTGTAVGRLSLTLETADGERAATGSVQASAGRAWTAFLRDSEGVPRGPWPGDVITVSGDLGQRRVRVADAALQFDRVTGTVTGRTAPSMPVDLAIGRGTNSRLQHGSSDSRGAFRFEFGPGDTVRGRAPVTVTLQAPEDDLTTILRLVPYAVVSLHPGDVSGAARPNALVQLELLESGRTSASAQAVADEGGQFLAWLRDPAGNLARPHAGQVVRVRDPDQEFVVPVADVTGTYDLESNTLLGTGVPGQELSLVVWNPYSPEYAEPSTIVGPDGRWSLDPGIDIDPASHFYVTQHLPEGDEVFYCLQIPALHVQPGSSAVGIEALWDVAADVALERDGARVASSSGSVDYEGWLSLQLASPTGQPVPVAPGDRVVATVDGLPRSFDVLRLEAWITSDGTLEGVATAGQTVVLSDRATMDTVVAAPDGSFAFDVSEYTHQGWAQSGEAFGAFVRASSGDHIRSHFQGPSLEAELDGTSLIGSAMPRSVFTITRPAAPTALVTGTVGFDGKFSAELPATARAGDSLVLTTGPVSTTLPIPALSAAVDLTAGSIWGKGPAHTILGVDAYVGQASFPARLFARTDDNGDWVLNLRAPEGGGAVTDPWRVTRFEIRHRDGANDVRYVVEGPALTAHRAFLAKLFRP